MRIRLHLRNRIVNVVKRYPRIANYLRRVLRRQRQVEGPIVLDFFAQASALANTGRHQDAVDVLQAGLAKNPYHMQAHETLIQVLAHLGRHEEALCACVQALKLDAGSTSLLTSLDVVLSTVRDTRNPEGIIELLNKCKAVVPRNLNVHLLLLDLLVKMKRFGEAMQACELVLKLDPEFLPAFKIIDEIAKNPEAQNAVIGTSISGTLNILDDYCRIAAGNVADFLGRVMSTFYTKLGTDPLDTPLMQGLDRFRRTLSINKEDTRAGAGTLASFERAWSQYQMGVVDEALPKFEAIFRDRSARRKAVYNPYVKTAVVRSGEILGRRYDNLGDVDSAISIYREIMTLDRNSLIAGRLLLLLTRSGNLRAAAQLAEDAIVSRPNLYPRLFESSYIASLKDEISRC
jgi:tetratricopeptide (TPR) repeat protein